MVGAALRLTENNGSCSRDVGRVRDSLSDNDRYAQTQSKCYSDKSLISDPDGVATVSVQSYQQAGANCCESSASNQERIENPPLANKRAANNLSQGWRE